MENENTNPINLSNQPPSSESTAVAPIQQQTETLPPKSENNHDTNTRTIVTVLVLLFAFPIGLLLMWFWTKWPKWVKFLITLPLFLAIAGIIVALTVATADPFKNLAKAQDANVKSTGEELSKALFSYYNQNEAFPWNNSVATTSAQVCVSPQNAYVNTTFMPCVQALIEDNQLKSGFISPLIVDEILSKLVVNDTGSSYSVCYLPTVQSADSIYSIEGNSCTSKGNCYVCIKQPYQ